MVESGSFTEINGSKINVLMGTFQNHFIFFFMYCPDTARIRKKMLYSSSFDYLKKRFVGIKKVVNINDESDLKEEFVKDKATEGFRT